LDPESGEDVGDGGTGEIVITNLGRTASPVIRYRTGDIAVKDLSPCPCGRTWMRLRGGILARADDMINVRGVNVYPASIEAVVRQFPAVVEFRSVVSRAGALRSLRVEVEVAAGAAEAEVAGQLAVALRQALGLTVGVHTMAGGTLPRFEMKASRFVVEG
jgi:phenylacetate-CoA ligase